jgi:uncharacterized protein (DUF302 family)
VHTPPDGRIYQFTGIRIIIHTPQSFSTVLDRLRALMGRASIPDLVALASEPVTEVEFTRRVNERYVGKSGFMLFGEIDHGGWISTFGIHRRAIRLILGNPLIAITMIRHDLTAGLFAPVEILVTEDEKSQGTTVVYVLPSSLILIEDNPPLRIATEALDEKLAALVGSAVCA